jgi:hypothetical protein
VRVESSYEEGLGIRSREEGCYWVCVSENEFQSTYSMEEHSMGGKKLTAYIIRTKLAFAQIVCTYITIYRAGNDTRRTDVHRLHGIPGFL